MTEAMPFLQKYDITFLRPPAISGGFSFGAGCGIIGIVKWKRGAVKWKNRTSSGRLKKQ